MKDTRQGVWIAAGVGAGIFAAVGLYFLLRAYRKDPASATVQRVEAIIREAEDLIKHNK